MYFRFFRLVITLPAEEAHLSLTRTLRCAWKSVEVWIQV
jgi:hypothetical protein